MKKIYFIDDCEERLFIVLKSLEIEPEISKMLLVQATLEGVSYEDTAAFFTHDTLEETAQFQLRKQCAGYNIPVIFYSGGYLENRMGYDSNGCLIVRMRFPDVLRSNFLSFIHFYKEQGKVEVRILLYGLAWKKALLMEFRNNILGWLSQHVDCNNIMAEDFQQLLPSGLQNCLGEPLDAMVNCMVENDIDKDGSVRLRELERMLFNRINQER